MNANYSKALRGVLFSWMALAFVLTAAPFTAAPALATDAFQSACKLYNAGKYRAAKEAFIELLCAKPDFWPARYQLANAYMQTGQVIEASMEYEKVLEHTQDAKTKKNCLKALSYIKDRTGTPMSAETEEQLNAQIEQASEQLTIAGRKRLAEAEAQVEKARNEVLTKARVKASHITNQAKEQAAAQLASSNWYARDKDNNFVPMCIPYHAEQAIVHAATERADAIKDEAKVKADSMRAPAEDDVTENLKTQLRNNAAKAKFRMSPVGTNEFVRNYMATPNRSNVAAKSDTVK